MILQQKTDFLVFFLLFTASVRSQSLDQPLVPGVYFLFFRIPLAILKQLPLFIQLLVAKVHLIVYYFENTTKISFTLFHEPFSGWNHIYKQHWVFDRCSSSS